jgi:hypothetical protein
VFCADSALTSLTMTRAPSAANSKAMARPIPEPAPVIRATRPSSFIGDAPLLCAGVVREIVWHRRQKRQRTPEPGL